MHDVFDSMERDIMTPSGMSSRLPTIDFPGSSIGLVSAVPSMGREGSLGMNLDFHETNNGYELSADLPGMKKEDIKVDIDSESGVLTLTGERKQEREEKSEGDNEQVSDWPFVLVPRVLLFFSKITRDDSVLRFPSLFRSQTLSAYPLHTNSGCGKERRILIGPW